MNTHFIKESNAEAEYDRNKQLMLKAKRDLGISRIFCVFANFAVFAIAIMRTFLWSVNTRVEIMVELGATELTEKAFPLFSVLLFYAPIMGVLALLSDINTSSRGIRICGYTSIAALVLVVLNTLVQIVYTKDDIFMIIYLALEIIFAFISLNAHGQIDILSTKEGFPDFNYAVQRNITTEQKKYMQHREDYVLRQTAGLRKNDPERASDDIIIDKADGHEMDGVSVDTDDQERWFRQSQLEQAIEDSQEEEEDMSDIAADPDYLPTEEFYKNNYRDKEDIRRLPL
ncbi:MAG: hypothetical protein II695_10810 [Oscillospiraceae bacterium]|nr:hypothetical protein [Oscillospiraceae bacterium]